MDPAADPTRSPDAVAEDLVRDLADAMLAVRDGECLACYLARMLTAHGCVQHRFVSRFRDRTAPRATALERRLGRSGGFCDCEVLMNVYVSVDELRAVARERARSLWDVDGWDVDEEAGGRPLAPPACEGVRRGSTQPCGQWRSMRARRWQAW